MKFCFVTFGNYNRHPTLKRATGMATPLLEQGHSVTLLIEDSDDNREKVARECPNAEIIFHKRGVTPGEERRQKNLTLKSLSPDVVWICGVGLRNWVKRPSTHCIVLGDHSELVSAVERRPLRKVYEYLCEWAHLFTFDGHILASRYLEAFYKRRLNLLNKSVRLHYSPYAHDIDLINSARIILPELEAKHTKGKRIVYMGGCWESYGFWDMLHAIKDIAKHRKDFEFLLLGKGPELESGRKWVEENNLRDVIYLPGYVPETHLSSYFTFADAFICTLRDTVQDWARCPSKLYMYLPFEKPIITSPIGEARELFGDDGLYYTPGDRAALANTIQDVLWGQRKQKLPSPEKHSWDARTTAFLAWLNEESSFR